MKNLEAAKSQVERALAYAHAALDDKSGQLVAQARHYAEDVLPLLSSMQPGLTLDEACRLFERINQLRVVLRALDLRVDAHGKRICRI